VNKTLRGHKNISLYWSEQYLSLFPILSAIRILSGIFFKIPENICGFRLSERALFCIFVRVFQDMADVAFDRYLLKQTLQKKLTIVRAVFEKIT
jgi:hypothetical protein